MSASDNLCTCRTVDVPHTISIACTISYYQALIFFLQNVIITPFITEVCANCIGVNCMSECRPVSGNNPFRINNIVNGTNYTVSLSLSSVFGRSEEGAPELYGEGKLITVYVYYLIQSV